MEGIRIELSGRICRAFRQQQKLRAAEVQSCWSLPFAVALLLLLPRLVALLHGCETELLPKAEPCKNQPEPAEPVKLSGLQVGCYKSFLCMAFFCFLKLAGCTRSQNKVKTERQIEPRGRDSADAVSRGPVGCAVQYRHFPPCRGHGRLLV